MSMRLPWMTTADRRAWRAADETTIGPLMADWLEGRIGSRPGYTPRYGPDPETGHLVPVLADLCRAGYVTTQSQPGERDGDWVQRAAVEGVVLNPQAGARLRAAANSIGAVVDEQDHTQPSGPDLPIPVTYWDGNLHTAFGGRATTVDMRLQWEGVGRGLRRRLAIGTYLTIVATPWGPEGETLWDALATAVQPAPHCPSAPPPVRLDEACQTHYV